jgi:hypothetical protein
MARQTRSATLSVRVDEDRLVVAEKLRIAFQRTLRIPDDGQTYPLPPGLGPFPIRRDGDAFLIPMYQREALWLSFEGPWWKPCAVKIGIGGIDALTGAAWDEELRDDPQNYLVAPDQPWIDGINSGTGTIRQFVAMPLGHGYTVEGQLTGEEKVGGLQLVVFDAKPGRFPDAEPPLESPTHLEAFAGGMGIGAGGTMTQKIYPDAHGLDTWDPSASVSIDVRIVNASEWKPPPPTPVDAEAYTRAGLPWFKLYDEEKGDLAASERLARVRSIDKVR